MMTPTEFGDQSTALSPTKAHPYVSSRAHNQNLAKNTAIAKNNHTRRKNNHQINNNQQ